jgi:hypothetical protein
VDPSDPLDLDLTDRINGGEKLTGVLGLRRRIRRGRAEVDLRRGSGGPNRRGICIRRTEEDGDLVGLVVVDDCFLLRGVGAAGVASGDDVLQVSSGELDWLQNKARKGVRGMRHVEGRRLEE